MERYNSFNIIHKGLRAALFDTALRLQTTDFTLEDAAEEAVNRVKTIVMLFQGHAQKEDDYILPMISEYEPSVAAGFNGEHEEDEKLGLELEHAAERVLNASSATESRTSGRELTEAFIRFLVFNLTHMAKEENIINKILWRYYSDDQIKEITGRIGQSEPAWKQDIYATWMLRGINNAEAVSWMKAIEKGAPPVVFQTLLQKAEQELPEKRFRQVKLLLTEEMQVL